MPDSVFFQPEYYEEHRVLRINWLAEPSFERLKKDYNAIIRQIGQRQIACLLLDLRHRDPPTHQFARWFNLDWLPRATASVLPAMLRLAYLTTPERRYQIRGLALSSPAMAQALSPAVTYKLQLFTDDREALDWLLA